MSSVMLAADDAAIEGRQGVSLLQRVQGVAAGVLFLATRIPLYLGLLLLGALASLAGVVLYLIRAVALRLTRPAGSVAAAALTLIAIAGPRHAKADTVGDASLLQQTTLVFSQQTNLYSFNAPGAGTLSVTLQDWTFPVALQQLTASIMFDDQSWSLTPEQNSPTPAWVLNLPVSSGGLFDAFVAAEAGTSSYGMQLGAYSMNIEFEPASTVPLPPAIDLLLGGMGLLGAVTLVERISRRRNTGVISIA